MEITESGMTKSEFAIWLHGLHKANIRAATDPEKLMQTYANECENVQDGIMLCEVRARHSETGNPMPFSMPATWFWEEGTSPTVGDTVAESDARPTSSYHKKIQIEVELWVSRVSDMPGIAAVRKATGVDCGRDWRASARYPNGHTVWEWCKTEEDAIAWCEDFKGGVR